MTIVEKIHDLEAIEQLRGDWERLRETSEFETLSIEQYLNLVSSDERALSALVLVIRTDGRISGILPFAVFSKPRKFVVGELRLFSITHKVLQAACVMIGELNVTQARLLVSDLSKEKLYDSINLYEIPTDHNLFKIFQDNSSNLKVSSAFFDVFPHWIIDFPDSFDSYLSSLKTKRRSDYLRQLRRLRESYEVVFETMTECSDIEKFLEKGEIISRQTYQWDLGTRLINDAQSRRKFEILAKQNELRCYLLYADDVAIAFAWGHLINNVFHYETPGFLREYSRWSPGTIIFMKIFEDLIENTKCRRFDFGMGGDFTGYKSQYGKSYYNAAIVEFYPCKSFRSWVLYLLDRFFWQVKRILRRFISPELKLRLNQTLRKVGILK